ncbi:MAG: sigma-54-dependent Fis family transcriptional regulator, partial [Bacteroidaceae bacterium]|nr:sigma-54-dependent Fis family transcriptional regulator [Bacteroidaceae bacterium]
MNQGTILIVDDNEDVLFALNLLLKPHFRKVKVSTTPDRIAQFMESDDPDVILLDMNFSRDASSGQEGMEVLHDILKRDTEAVVVMMTAYSDMSKAINAIKAGATDFVAKPWENEKLIATLTAAAKLRQARREKASLQKQMEGMTESSVPPIIGRSGAMMKVLDMVEVLAKTDANVLILGENGTGKDLVARALHGYSSRAAHPLVTIDLGSIPETLFEGELFGYERGAFTDAHKPKAGRMEIASGGTLFLDEIGNLSLPLQSKLLSAIEKGTFTRLGSTREQRIDVRFICATNSNLHERVS